MKIEDLNYSVPTMQADEKDFDKEKWRKENPMDYFKAVHLILTSINNVPEKLYNIVMAETFKTIYKITRFHIPDILYKFYSLTDDRNLNKVKLSTLRNMQIFVSDIQDFNDPFDGKAFFYKPSELSDIKRLAPFHGQLIDDFTVFIKGTALTENDTNCMPMWAHYANNHQGFCVSYDMKNPVNNLLSACTFPIQYTDQRLDITTFIKKYAEMFLSETDRHIAQGEKKIEITDLSIVYMALYLFNIKQSTWQYEKEFRCTIGATAKGKPYIDALPNAIYIGMKCCESNRKELISIAQELSIPIYQMKLDEFSEDYALESERL